MKRLHTVPAAILGVLLLASLVAVYATRDSGNRPPVPATKAPNSQVASIDTQLMEAANRMAALAETDDEQKQAREALRLADHELDQAFATALRQAAAYRPPATGPLRELVERVDQLKAQVAWDQRRVAQLAKQADAKDKDLRDLANAQLALDQDELDEAQQDLARQGGDPHPALEQARQGHEAIAGQTAQALKGARARPLDTLTQQVQAWAALGSTQQQLLNAEQQASSQAIALAGEHNQLEKQTHARQPDAESETVESLGLLSDQRKTLAELDKRIQDCQGLAGIYRSWIALLQTRRQAVLHLLLTSLAKIIAILLAAILATIAIRRFFRLGDRHRLYQGRVIASVAVQLVAVVFVLLVIFGPPNQLSTIIGLTTAGLTVVLGNFIVSFFGWFTLMGKNGIRVGDWVEINGVGGEVIEIGVLKTVLLESGNLNDTGQPTGRQVAFSNSFAMNGHYFNFSTAGQWLWDELEVTVPDTGDPYLLAEEIRKLVEHETEADFAQAAKDWERVTNRYGTHSFSEKPTVSLRPTGNGVKVVVRYITHAPERYAVKSRLFQVIINLLHKPAGNEAAPTEVQRDR